MRKTNNIVVEQLTNTIYPKTEYRIHTYDENEVKYESRAENQKGREKMKTAAHNISFHQEQ
jgi:hypothetical protein